MFWSRRQGRGASLSHPRPLPEFGETESTFLPGLCGQRGASVPPTSVWRIQDSPANIWIKCKCCFVQNNYCKYHFMDSAFIHCLQKQVHFFSVTFYIRNRNYYIIIFVKLYIIKPWYCANNNYNYNFYYIKSDVAGKKNKLKITVKYFVHRKKDISNIKIITLWNV